MSAEQPIADVVEKLEDATANANVTLGDLLEEFGQAAYSSALLCVGVILASPMSGVPAFSSACGIVIFLVAAQGALARPAIWIPARLAQLHLSSPRTEKVISKIRATAAWIDARSKARLTFLVTQPMSRFIYAICAIAGLCLPPMEFIPMTSSLLGLAVALIAAGLLTRDGLIAMCGLLILPIVFVIVMTAATVVSEVLS